MNQRIDFSLDSARMDFTVGPKGEPFCLVVVKVTPRADDRHAVDILWNFDGEPLRDNTAIANDLARQVLGETVKSAFSGQKTKREVQAVGNDGTGQTPLVVVRSWIEDLPPSTQYDGALAPKLIGIIRLILDRFTAALAARLGQTDIIAAASAKPETAAPKS